jgi:hypothetical protein
MFMGKARSASIVLASSIEAEASKPKHRSRSIEATSKFQNLAISKFPF